MGLKMMPKCEWMNCECSMQTFYTPSFFFYTPSCPNPVTAWILLLDSVMTVGQL